MSSEIRTFRLSDDNLDEQAKLAEFLRTVDVRRIDTAYGDGAWHILVLFQDLRRKEESAQIASAITAALTSWRDRFATRQGVARETVLPDELIPEIARYAPTTEHELRVLASTANYDAATFGNEIVQVVRQTMESLID